MIPMLNLIHTDIENSNTKSHSGAGMGHNAGIPMHCAAKKWENQEY